MALTTPKQVLHDVKVGYIAATGDTDTITYGNIASKCNAAYGGGGGMDWGDTITDDWDTIIANANAGTVSGYSIGDTKTLEFKRSGMPVAVQCELIGKSHDTISGTANTAALTFMFKYLVTTYGMNASNTNAGGWLGENGDLYANSLDETGGELSHGCAARKFIYKILADLPSNIKNAIKTVDKQYDDDTTIRTTKDKLWLPSVAELNTTMSYVRAGQGTAYSDIFTNNASRVKRTFNGNNYWWTRSRSTSSSASFCYVDSSGAIGYHGASNTDGITIGFCL